MEYLIIDGYNIINSWNDIFDLRKEPLEDCRVKLLDLLSNYQGYKNIEVIVVFDAHLVSGGQEKQETYGKLTVIYTKENESADNYIERFVYRMAGKHQIRVATSDYLEQRMILSDGGIRMSSRELKEEIRAAPSHMKGDYGKSLKKDNTIASHVNPELLEKMRRGKM